MQRDAAAAADAKVDLSGQQQKQQQGGACGTAVGKNVDAIAVYAMQQHVYAEGKLWKSERHGDVLDLLRA